MADRDGWFATLGATLDGVSLMAYERSTSAAVLSSVPMLLVFFAMQKQIIAGLTKGAVKG